MSGMPEGFDDKEYAVTISLDVHMTIEAPDPATAIERANALLPAFSFAFVCVNDEQAVEVDEDELLDRELDDKLSDGR